jgi:CrcB protein
MITALAFAAVAGVTAIARALISEPLNDNTAQLPLGTLVVNVSGSLALGLLAGVAPPAATIIGAGGLGAYTTFSRFSVEVEELHRRGANGLAAGYVVVSVAACIAAAWLGLIFAI